jgi:hypothetical protein
MISLFLSQEEYHETKQHTLQQLQAFQNDLNQMMAVRMGIATHATHTRTLNS